MKLNELSTGKNMITVCREKWEHKGGLWIYTNRQTSMFIRDKDGNALKDDNGSYLELTVDDMAADDWKLFK